MTLHSLLLYSAAFFFFLSTFHYLANDRMAAWQITQSRFISAHPWILTCFTLLVSLGMIAYGLINIVTTPEKWQHLPNVLIGLYLLVSGKNINAATLERLKEQVEDPDSTRRFYKKAAKALFAVATLLLLVAFAVGNEGIRPQGSVSESSWAS
jgi:hypothetical protein